MDSSTFSLVLGSSSKSFPKLIYYIMDFSCLYSFWRDSLSSAIRLVMGVVCRRGKEKLKSGFVIY